MRKIVGLALFCALWFTGSAQIDSTLMLNIPYWVRSVLEKSELVQKHIILDEFNPFYLEADFNGDKETDIAFFVENKIDHSKGVLIINKGKNVAYVIGAGTTTEMGANLSWGKRWFVHRDKYLSNNGKKKLIIKYPAIQLMRSETSSLIIYWTGKKYKTFNNQV